MPDDREKPGSFAQQFLGRSRARSARVLRPEPPAEAPSAPQLGLFSPPPARDSTPPPPPPRLSRPPERRPDRLPERRPADLQPRLPSAAEETLHPETTSSVHLSLEHRETSVTQATYPADDARETDSSFTIAESLGTTTSPPARRVWTVRELVADLRRRVENAFVDIWVEGEISACRPASSGHLYFTLKDGEAQLPVVLFRRQSQLLRFRPTDGLAVLVRGRLSIYESRGQLQLIAETLEPRGAGALQLAFEQLKARLLAEGLFAAERKRPLPPYPHCIGVITSTGGAVIRDIVTVVRRRHACLNLLVYPVPVQGAACPSAVVRAIRWFNAHPERADLLVLARGGGSPEDLAGFNDEAMARAIAASSLPIVSAIGHETDFTIADFVADLRAPTPSAAAEIITAAQHRVAERVDSLERRVLRAGEFRLLAARQRFDRLSSAHVLARAFDGIARRGQRLDDLRQRLEAAVIRRGASRRQRLAMLQSRLDRQSPHARLAASTVRLATLRARLDRVSPAITASRETTRLQLTSRLHALSPLAVLARGYALVYGPDGTLISSSGELRPGDSIRARLAQGAVLAQVTETQQR